MKYYELKYVAENNGETGAGTTYNIARSTNKADIDKIIADNNLKVVTKLERGQAHVFLLTEFEPNFPTYFEPDVLAAAIKADKEWKEKPVWNPFDVF